MTKTFLPVHYRKFAVISADLAMIGGSFVLSFLLRFEFSPDASMLELMMFSLPFVIATYLAGGYIFSLYKGIYHFSSFSDLINITKTIAASGTTAALVILFVRQGQFPRSILILHPLLCFLGICGVRFVIRLVKNLILQRKVLLSEVRSALIVGAGEMGESILRQIQKTPQVGMRVAGFIDDDRSKWGMNIHGVPVLGGRDKIAAISIEWEIDEIILAIEGRRGDLLREIIESTRKLPNRPEIQVVPTLDEMFRSSSSDVKIRKVKPADLLNRKVVHLDEPRIAETLERRCILVTGAGGTIGSELCRQALRYNPHKLILLENHATSIFYRYDEMLERAKGTAVIPILGDLRDQSLLERVFSEHKPNIVLHAGAHKHLHQLEFNIAEGISNNTIGTYRVAKTAEKYGAEAFLLVSTDKAVSPSSVMGASKRAAERVVCHLAQKGSSTRFMCVRFGNVLGSSGSVLRIFQNQLEAGGPITVRDERVTRYFMTVEEAVGLILQAVSMGKGGEVFVLKMGTPVRIIDMARNLILLSGLEPGKDIEIEITGLKQGEKLDEELVEDPRGATPSEHPDITILNGENHREDGLEQRILDLEIISRGKDQKIMVQKLREIIPTFTPSKAHSPERLD